MPATRQRAERSEKPKGAWAADMSTPTQLGAVFGLVILLVIFGAMTIALGVVTLFHPWAAIGFVCGLIFCLNLIWRLRQESQS